MMATAVANVNEDRVLVLTPTGKDGTLAVSVLTEAGIRAAATSNLQELCRQLSHGAGALLLAQEALSTTMMPALIEQLKHQPAWSDIPIIFLTAFGEGFYTSLRIIDMFRPAGSVTILERPLQKLTLVSAIQAALRSRRRQYQVRDLLRKLEESQSELQDKIQDLEKFEQVVVGRELKMIGLERENHELKEALRRGHL
ncbi:MAG TPA: hypothetical protein VJ692_15430 [Nitrospiraceae bacterium]|nr:hypothetical protein [Nitrospiraceae bacterium]